jgi:hypothetical protein
VSPKLNMATCREQIARILAAESSQSEENDGLPKFDNCSLIRMFLSSRAALIAENCSCAGSLRYSSNRKLSSETPTEVRERSAATHLPDARYHSEEPQATYQLSLVNGVLMLKNGNRSPVSLHPRFRIRTTGKPRLE